MRKRIATWATSLSNRDGKKSNHTIPKGPGIKPDYAEAHNNLGNAFSNRETRLKPFHYQKALEIKPDYRSPKQPGPGAGHLPTGVVAKRN